MYQVRLILSTTCLYLFILPLFKMADADKTILIVLSFVTHG
jgi:hypothetical protein